MKQVSGTNIHKKSDTHTEQGDDAMSKGVLNYAKLDLHSLEKKNIKTVSSKEALKDVVPVQWDEDILQGKKKVTLYKREN